MSIDRGGEPPPRPYWEIHHNTSPGNPYRNTHSAGTEMQLAINLDTRGQAQRLTTKIRLASVAGLAAASVSAWFLQGTRRPNRAVQRSG